MNFLKKHRVLVVILIGLVYFAGVAAVLYPIVSNMLSLTTAKTEISAYDKMVEDMDEAELNNMLENAEKYNNDIANGNYHNGYETALNEYGGIICYVEIPSINVYLPVYYGTSNDVLAKGCGFLENTSFPIGGTSTHSVISGHTGLPTADMFTNLDRLVIGDTFYIHILGKVLAYEVDNIEAVMPDRVDLLDVVEGRDYITLLTCTPYGINDKRLLVRGKRIEYYEPEAVQAAVVTANNDSADEGLSDEIVHELIKISLIVILSVAVFAAACIWLWMTEKKFRTIAAAAEKTDDDPEDDHGEEKE